MAERQPRYHPEQGDPERAEDMAFIQQHLEMFWHLSRLGYELAGRGALVVDATPQQQSEVQSRMQSFAYQPQEQVQVLFDADVQHMVRMYDPNWEFVTVLFKGNREDSYRMRMLFANPS